MPSCPLLIWQKLKENLEKKPVIDEDSLMVHCVRENNIPRKLLFTVGRKLMMRCRYRAKVEDLGRVGRLGT